jgi:hypothetical protein
LDQPTGQLLGEAVLAAVPEPVDLHKLMGHVCDSKAGRQRRPNVRRSRRRDPANP